MGIVVGDPQLRCTWVNDTMESHDGISRDRRLGRRFTDVRPGAGTEALESAMRQAVRSGPTKVHDYRTRLPSSPHREHTFAASIFCLQDADGLVLGVCVISVDVTESRRARDRLAILSEGSTRLGSSLDVMRTSQDRPTWPCLCSPTTSRSTSSSRSPAEKGPRSTSGSRASASLSSGAPVWPRFVMGSRSPRGCTVRWSPGRPPRPSPMS
ncbi:PAS domain-containing protein [Streptomyces sp. NPDC054813]